jgi:hypothetical protein
MSGDDQEQAGKLAGTVCYFQELYLAKNKQLGRDRKLGEPVEVTLANCLSLIRFHTAAAFLSFLHTNCPVNRYSGL